MTMLINNSSAAFNIPCAIPNGKYATFKLTGSVEAEFRTVNEAEADPATNSLVITDSTDPIDVTKKVINAANNLRQLRGPMDLRIIGAGGSAVTLTVNFSA